MCEMASSCLCVVALAMASGSCSGKGSTSLQMRNQNHYGGKLFLYRANKLNLRPEVTSAQ